MNAFLFYTFASLAVGSALSVILASRPPRALLSLLVTMTALSCLYVLLGASFVAMINLIVYAGAVLVLFLFVIMLLGLGAKDVPIRERFGPLFIPAAGVLAGGLLSVLALIFKAGSPESLASTEITVREIAHRLFTVYLLPFELISLLLLLAILAAVSLAKKEEA